MDGENEDDRESGRDRIELPGSHTANINPSEKKKKTRAGISPRGSRHLIQSTSKYLFFFFFKRVNDDWGVSLSSRSYRHPKIPDTMKSY